MWAGKKGTVSLRPLRGVSLRAGSDDMRHAPPSPAPTL